MSSPPAWSMGASRRQNAWNATVDVPGPGSYDIRNNKTLPGSPGCRIGTAPRSYDPKNDIPGPGTYNTSDKLLTEGPKYHFGVKTNTSFYLHTDNPGPGAYDTDRSLSNHRRSPAYSIIGRNRHIDNDHSPGPGAYNTETSLLNKTMPSIRIGSAKRDGLALATDSPGPGAYAVKNEKFFGKVAPRVVFGQARRDEGLERAALIPGPGAYEQPSTLIKKNGGITMASKKDSFATTQTFSPGPGAYDVKDRSVSNKKRNPTATIGRATREGFYSKNDTPGPGTYKMKMVDKTNAPNVRLGTAKRQPLSGSTVTPGPGAYEIRSASVDGPKYSLSSRHMDLMIKNKDIPGPGAYQPSNSFYKTRGEITIGHEKRQSINRSEQGPGPGYYDIGSKWRGRLAVIGRERRDAGFVDRRDPGPGQYNIPSKIADVPRYVFPDKSKLKIKPI